MLSNAIYIFNLCLHGKQILGIALFLFLLKSHAFDKFVFRLQLLIVPSNRCGMLVELSLQVERSMRQNCVKANRDMWVSCSIQ